MRYLRAITLAGFVLMLNAVSATAQGGTVACKDGTKSKGGQGACSGHGGVAPAAEAKPAKADAKADKSAMKATVKAAKSADKPAMKADMKAAKASDKAPKADTKAATKADKGAADDKIAAGATAECKDGTYSHAKTHQGACSRHGGVSKFLDGK
ncbi:MAG: DUF3761 domain-containing protein [bacterium]